MKMLSDQNGTTLKRSRGRPRGTGRKNELLTDSPKFEVEDLRRALFDVEDALARSQIQFILLDEIAHQVAYQEDPQLSASEVSIGIRIQDFTESGSSTLKSIIPQADWKDFIHGTELTNLSYTVGSVPVIIWFIHNDLDVFKNPDMRFYYTTEFRIPNPFKEYWRKRDLIK